MIFKYRTLMTESLYFVHVFNQEVVERSRFRYVLYREMALKTVASGYFHSNCFG